jgi:hypothetical protein
MGKEMRADIILKSIQNRHKPFKDIFLTEVKTGPTWNNQNLRKIDAVAIKRSWRQPCITAYEIKTTRQDFLRDDKWPEYLPYCHRFYFVCPNGVIEKKEVESPVGLIWVDPETHGHSVKQQAVFRNIDIPGSMFYHLVISHMDYDRHPFFSDTREYLEAWIADKKDGCELGIKVSSKMWTEMREAKAKILELKKKVDFLQEEEKRFQEVKKILSGHGVRTGYGFIDSLKTRLDCNIPKGLRSSLRAVKEAIDMVLDIEKEK